MVPGAAAKAGRVLGFGVLLGTGLALFGVGSTPAADASGLDATTAALAVPDAALSAPAAPRQAPEAPLNASIKAPSAPAPLDSAACPVGMVEVDGDYCPYVEQKCLRWLDPETHMRCAEFAPTAACSMRSSHEHFCIDRFEYPNREGEKPRVMVTWTEAQKLCGDESKRLCGESEWTLACEGSERLPYPYGYTRNPDACNIDRPHPEPNEQLFRNPATRGAELARLDQRAPSGANESCVSPFGAYDMTGNVDEWVVNDRGVPHKSGLKGGYWGPVRDRCRPMTTAHDESFAFYQIGFRCCADAAPARRSGPGASRHELIAGS